VRNIILVLSVLFLFGFTACDDNNSPDCTFGEFVDILANSNCISEDFISTCRKISRKVSCFSEELEIRVIDHKDCIVIDCQTLSCDTFVVEGTPFQSGLMTEMEFDEATNLPRGIFVVDNLVADFQCLLFQN